MSSETIYLPPTKNIIDEEKTEHNGDNGETKTVEITILVLLTMRQQLYSLYLQ